MVFRSQEFFSVIFGSTKMRKNLDTSAFSTNLGIVRAYTAQLHVSRVVSLRGAWKLNSVICTPSVVFLVKTTSHSRKS